MIASITGKVQSKHADSLILDVQGVGFDVTVTKSVLSDVEPGDLVFLHTYLVVREDMLALYGFRTVEEKQFFLLLLGVEGIGPRLAMAVLSTLSLDNIRTAVVSEQPEFFSPGLARRQPKKSLSTCKAASAQKPVLIYAGARVLPKTRSWKPWSALVTASWKRKPPYRRCPRMCLIRWKISCAWLCSTLTADRQRLRAHRNCFSGMVKFS